MSDEQREGEQLVSLVDRTRQKLRRNALLTGGGLAAAAALAWFVIAVGLDLLVSLPVWARITLWTGFWIVLTLAVALGLVWPAVRRLRRTDVALRIERAVGGMHNRLLTVLELRAADNGHAASANPAFVHRLIEQTRRMLSGYRPEQVASPRPVRRSLAAAAVAAAVIAAIAGLWWQRMPQTLARVAMPSRDIPPATHLKLQAPGDLKVLEGDARTIEAKVLRGEPGHVTLQMRAENGSRVRYPMEPAGGEPGTWRFRLSAVTKDYQYRIRSGRAWTRSYSIEAIERPVIESVAARVRMPGYMRIDEARTVTAVDRIKAPEGATIQFRADVSEDAERGELRLLEAKRSSEKKTVTSETVWFEDELPKDAQTFGRWQWTTARAHSGVRSHTFSWRGEPHGFRTRLHRMEVPGGASLYVYAYLDPDQTPQRLSVGFYHKHGNNQRLAVAWWGPPDPSKKGQKAKPARRTALADVPKKQWADGNSAKRIGDLPEPGKWARLEIPLKSIPHVKPKKGTTLTGMAFASVKGRASFDRPGYLTRRTKTVQTKTMEPIGTHEMRYNDDAGRWVADLLVRRDVHYTLRFHNHLDAPNKPRKPGRIVAQSDEPPAVRVEKPGQDLTLARPEPVPVSVRAFDDYGVAAIGMQIAPKREALKDAPKADADSIEWFAEYEQPKTSQLALTALRPSDHDLKPGAAVYYRLVARDYNGQVAVSAPTRLAIASKKSKSKDTVERSASLDGLISGIGELLKVPAQLGSKLLPDGGEVRLTDEQGRPLTDQQIAERAQKLYGNLSEEEREQLQQVNKQLLERQKKLKGLAERLGKAAQEAVGSPLALPNEPAALQALADRADQLAEQAAPSALSEGKQAAMERLLRARRQQSELREGAESLQSELSQMQQTRQDSADQPQAAGQQMQQMAARAKGRQAMDRLERLQRQLESRNAMAESMKEQIETLRKHAAEASPEEMAEISEKQAQLDRQAMALLKQNQQLLGLDEDKSESPPAPWEPPQRERKKMPTEQDTPPDEDQQDGDDDEGPEVVVAQQDEKEGEKEQENWWDQPVKNPSGPKTRTETPERFKGRQRETEEAEGDSDEPIILTPRQQLRQHQGSVGQKLTEDSRNLAQAALRAQQMQQQMGQALGQSQQGAGSSSQQGQQSPSSEQLQQELGSQQMQQMMQMADRARSMASGMPLGQQSSGGAGSTDARPRGWMPPEPENPPVEADGEQQAQLYDLPPKVRRPLMEGMKEKGPEGYQSMIDAYYKRLSEQVE